MKQNQLRDYFPILKTRDEILELIEKDAHLKSTFYAWRDGAQKEFLDFCSGQRGMKILYDSFFKEVFNPEYAPQRLNDLLSVILGFKVQIYQVLPLDSTRMGDETSLVTMDIVVELEDKSLINVEIQKIGYFFPGQRCACYSSDLLLRQYKRIRENLSPTQKFTYRMIHPVYTIVFFEHSPTIFHDYPNTFIHSFKQISDSGLSLELLQRYVFISLDIFKELRQNKDSELYAWLTFLSSDDPRDIVDLIERHPKFKPLYDTLFQLCENIEDVMNMFSKELYELDRNTAELMVDDFSRQVAELKEEVAKKDDAIAEKEAVIAEKDNTIAEKDNTIAEKDNTIAEKDITIAELMAKIKHLEGTTTQ